VLVIKPFSEVDEFVLNVFSYVNRSLRRRAARTAERIFEGLASSSEYLSEYQLVQRIIVERISPRISILVSPNNQENIRKIERFVQIISVTPKL